MGRPVPRDAERRCTRPGLIAKINDSSRAARLGHRNRLMNSTVQLSLLSKTIIPAAAALSAAALVFLYSGKRPAMDADGGAGAASGGANGAANGGAGANGADDAPGAQSRPLAALANVFAPDRASGYGSLAARFRLAGTILGVSNVGADDPMAIIDDKTAVRQSIVRRGQEVAPGIALASVKAASVVLSGPDGDEEIFLEKAASASASAPSAAAPDDGARADPAARFGGHEVFPGRWSFNRDAVLDYYSELRDDPQRLLSIFDSMDPVYETDPDDGTRAITGYVVGVEGEADFFKAAGLKDGDIVRAVNNVPMSNRRRAEAFIKSFIDGEASAFVMEIERDGKTEKQAYVIE